MSERVASGPYDYLVKPEFLRTDHKGWGFSHWQTLFSVADSFPLQPTSGQLERAYTYLYSLSYLLPCEECNGHFRAYLASNPPTFKTGPEFSTYILTFRQAVDKRACSHKPEGYTQEEIIKFNKICNRLDWTKVVDSTLVANGDTARKDADSQEKMMQCVGIFLVLVGTHWFVYQLGASSAREK